MGFIKFFSFHAENFASAGQLEVNCYFNLPSNFDFLFKHNILSVYLTILTAQWCFKSNVILRLSILPRRRNNRDNYKDKLGIINDIVWFCKSRGVFNLSLPPENIMKPCDGFLMFSEGGERVYWDKWVKTLSSIYDWPFMQKLEGFHMRPEMKLTQNEISFHLEKCIVYISFHCGWNAMKFRLEGWS